MDSNKPLCLLNTQINYRLGNQNCNLFSLLWAQTHHSASADDKQMNLCRSLFFQGPDIKEHYDNKGWIEFSLSMSVCKETLFFHFVSRLFHVFHPSVAKELWHAAFISTLLHYRQHFFWPQRGQTWLNIPFSEKHKHPVTIRLGEQQIKTAVATMDTWNWNVRPVKQRLMVIEWLICRQGHHVAPQENKKRQNDTDAFPVHSEVNS